MNKCSAESDEKIAGRAQAGDKTSFNILVVRYRAKLLRYGMQFLSDSGRIEDAVQEIFVNVYRNILSFDTSLRFSPWVYRIAHNMFINAQKKHARDLLVLVGSDELIERSDKACLEIENDESLERYAALEGRLENISEKYRTVLKLHYAEELGYKEIAEALNIPMSTVGVQLMRAKNALRKECLKQAFE